MSPNSKKTNLSPIIETAQQLHSKLESVIESGDEAQGDEIAMLYEAELDKVFDHTSETKMCVTTKLNFMKDLLSAEHPMPRLVERAFESLAADMKNLLGD
jgi:hypothetical protein